MNNSYFHHSLKVDQSACIGCTHCMHACPTEAIRVKGGKAVIDGNRCVDCGACYSVCPVKAVYVEQDDFNKIFKYKYRVALIPAVLIGQFPRNIPTRAIYSALIENGFTHVFEAELKTDILKNAIQDYQKQNKGIKPVISSFCPAVVRLIQVKFPALINHIMLLKAPHDFTASYIKKYLLNKGANEDEIGIFYITPCAAKIAAIKSPEGEKHSIISGVINMDFIYNKIYKTISDEQKTSSPLPLKFQLDDEAMTWGLTKGEAPHANGRCLSIDGIQNITDFLEKIENDEECNFDFLELRTCDQSCAGGILAKNNRFLTSERLHDRAEKYSLDKKAVNIFPSQKISSDIHLTEDDMKVGAIEPRSSLNLDDNFEEAIHKMERIREIMCYLPALDCGACGAPTCKSLAEDIVQKKASVSDCIYIQQNMEKTGTLNREHAERIRDKIWGKGKFDKDCYKKGAKYENK